VDLTRHFHLSIFSSFSSFDAVSMDFRLHLADQPVLAVALMLTLMLDLSTLST
jgi:hypothetical protein